MQTNCLKFPKVALVLIGVAVSVAGCLKQEKFPVEPVIEYKSFEQFGDSASMVFKFTDGDGDIGLDEGDTNSPFDTASTFYNNLFLEYFELQEGVWTPVDLPIRYRIKRITPTGQNKTLEGEIAIAMQGFPDNYAFLDSGQVRYSIQLVDRALHLSNVVQTEAISVP